MPLGNDEITVNINPDTGAFEITEQENQVARNVEIIATADDGTGKQNKTRIVVDIADLSIPGLKEIRITANNPHEDGRWRKGDTGKAEAVWEEGATIQPITWSWWSLSNLVEILMNSNGTFEVTRMDENRPGFGINAEIRATVEGTLLYNAKQITIENNNKDVSAISIINPPNKTTYAKGELFDPEGMVVYVDWTGAPDGPVTDYTWEPTTPLGKSHTFVSIRYTYNEYTWTVNQPITVLDAWKVSFYDGSTELTALTQTVIDGGYASLPDDPTKEGYTFDGWYKEKDCKNPFSFDEKLTEDTEVFAKWKATPYNITYNLNGGSGHSNPDTYTIETDTFTLENASHSVLVFDGWYAGENKVTQITKGSKGNLTLEARWKKAPAPMIIFPTASSITYGQILADSVLTGGSMQYGTFTWENPSSVPGAGTASHGMTFMPSAETERYYEPIPDASRKQDVRVTVTKTTPAVTISVKRDTAGTTATLTATVSSAGKGSVPTGSVGFEYSVDNGLTWAMIPTGDSVMLAVGTGTATLVWDIPDANTVYQLRASYSGDSNYNRADGSAGFDPRKQDQAGFEVKASATQVAYGDTLTFTVANGKGTGAVTYGVSDPSVMTVDGNGKAIILKAGNATVTAMKAGDNNYNAATASISVTIKKATLIFTAEDKTVNQGEAMPALTFKTTGLVNGDAISVEPILTTSAANTNNAGNFTITISGGTAVTKGGVIWTDCYDVVYKSGRLTINAPVTVTGITLNSDSAKKIYTEGDTLDVNGLTLTVSKSDGSKEPVNVTAAMVTDFDSSKLGKQTLTVNYEGFTATYEIEVKTKTNPPTTISYAAKNGSGNTIQSVTWQKGSGKNLDLTFKRSEDDHLTYGLFGSLEIGGATVGSVNYAAAEGSLKLSIKPEYLETLAVGDHTVKVNFQDGSATVKLTVKAAATQPQKPGETPTSPKPGETPTSLKTGETPTSPKTGETPTSPKTGDKSNLALWSSLMFLSVAGLLAVAVNVKRRRKTR